MHSPQLSDQNSSNSHFPRKSASFTSLETPRAPVTFSDGGSYPYPVMMRFEKKGGKTSLCWVNVKQNGDVMVYGRAL